MKSTFLILLLISSIFITAFGQNKNDVIYKAKKLLLENKYEQAENLLEKNYHKNKTDIEYIWLYAYTTHQTKQDNLSKELYEKAISISPNENNLKLEYARMLFEIGNLQESYKLIQILKSSSIEQSEVLLLDAKINYWLGKFDKANESLALLKKKYPDSHLADELTKQIKDTRATFIQAEIGYLTDNQPLKSYTESFLIGKYQSWLLYPTLSIKDYNFNPTAKVIEAKFSNLIQFGNIGTSIKTEAGVYYNKAINKNNFIGEISIKKSLSKKINLEFGINRKPYIATNTSTTIDLLQNNIFANLEKGAISKTLFLHLGYNYQFFSDQNSIQTFGIYGLTKPLFPSALKIQMGYGFSYSDSKTILYFLSEPTHKTTSNGISIFDGEYSPYFTPDNLMTNSAIVLIGFDLTNKIKISAKGNYGFYAKANTPQLISTSTQPNNLDVELKSYSTIIHPYNLELIMDYKLNNKLSLLTQLAYFNTYYYNSLNVTLRINYRF